MRPYLAIIKDCFREALATRVLYVLLFLITILLLAIAPFYLQETVEWKLNWQWNPPGQNVGAGNNVSNPEKIIERLVTRHNQPGEKPIARIWELLPDELTEKLATLNAEGNDPGEPEDVEDQGPGLSPKVRALNRQYNELVDALNKVIQNRDFYRPDDWANRPLPAEADGLLGQDVKQFGDQSTTSFKSTVTGDGVVTQYYPGRNGTRFLLRALAGRSFFLNKPQRISSFPSC